MCENRTRQKRAAHTVPLFARSNLSLCLHRAIVYTRSDLPHKAGICGRMREDALPPLNRPLGDVEIFRERDFSP